MRLVADTSAWIEFLRGTGSPADLALRRAIDGDRVVLIEPVMAEILMGARDGNEADRLQRMFEHFPVEVVSARDDFEVAARLYRSCRAIGRTPRGLIDCLVAATTARLAIPLLHHDRDLTVLTDVAGVAVEDGSLAA